MTSRVNIALVTSQASWALESKTLRKSSGKQPKVSWVSCCSNCTSDCLRASEWLEAVGKAFMKVCMKSLSVLLYDGVA